jgi:hypothetical protein
MTSCSENIDFAGEFAASASAESRTVLTLANAPTND